MPYKNPLDQKVCARQHYLKNKEDYKARVRAWGTKARKRNKEYVDAIKRLGCNICGYNKCSAAIDFHHLDPASKDFEIADMISRSKSIEAIELELAKCIRVCANCHREIHDGVIILKDLV